MYDRHTASWWTCSVVVVVAFVTQMNSLQAQVVTGDFMAGLRHIDDSWQMIAGEARALFGPSRWIVRPAAGIALAATLPGGHLDALLGAQSDIRFGSVVTMSLGGGVLRTWVDPDNAATTGGFIRGAVLFAIRSSPRAFGFDIRVFRAPPLDRTTPVDMDNVQVAFLYRHQFGGR